MSAGALVHAAGHYAGDGCPYDGAGHLVPRPRSAAELADESQRGSGSLVAGAIGRSLQDAWDAYELRAADLRQRGADCAEMHRREDRPA